MSDHFTAPGLADEERAWRAGVYDRYGFYDSETPDDPEPEEDTEPSTNDPDTPF